MNCSIQHFNSNAQLVAHSMTEGRVPYLPTQTVWPIKATPGQHSLHTHHGFFPNSNHQKPSYHLINNHLKSISFWSLQSRSKDREGRRRRRACTLNGNRDWRLQTISTYFQPGSRRAHRFSDNAHAHSHQNLRACTIAAAATSPPSPSQIQTTPTKLCAKKPTPSKTRGFLATGPINRPLRLKWLWMFWQCRVLKKYIIVPPGHFSSRELPEFSPCEQLLLGKQKSIYHVCNFCFHKQTHKKSSMHWAPQSGCDTPGTDTPRGSPSQGLWRSLAGKIPKLKETTTT